ncbi:catecholate siderophore receptor Fiu [Cellvibrio zantedeschiae]|uniref:Catecholate siderophore receptor Fiu n=1 Tax=Cellvibrio zantedeschiae TaxID=1237077 RepID=A0ABQ3AW70_9GAMM|nr:catecholate siderophore receptor Fiu [Cellvibrio zantedeschiae]GGY69768.1 catecholate siderophore receptor Fiu [Cellvibrio zantedeschiae]
MSKTKSLSVVAGKNVGLYQFKVSALSSMMLLVASGAMAAEPLKKDEKKAEPTSKLSTVKVNADALSTDFKAEKVSSAKFTQPLVDTPQTIVVVKKELFQQQAATSLSETLRNTPGITLLMGENGNTATGDSIFMRGFDTQGSIFVDGIRDLGSISRDTFNTEQVEIAKGPAGVDNGRGAASGYVNMSSKMANLDEATSGNVSLGSGNYKRATLDLNKTLGETSAIRVNLLKQDAGVAGRDKVENNYQGFAASLGLGLGTDTRIHANLLNVQQSGIPDGGISTIGLDGYYNAIFATGVLAGQKPRPVDTSNFYGSTSDHNDVLANMVTVRVEHDLTDTVTIRNTSRYGRTKQDQVLTGVNSVTFVPPTNPDAWTLSRSRQGKDILNKILTNQTNLTATFEQGSVKHELSGGIEFIYENQLGYTVGIPTGSPSQVPANLYNPGSGDLFQAVVRTGNKTEGETTTSAFYVLDTISFNEHWELSAGLRAENYHTRYDTLTRQTAVTPPAVQTIPVGTMVGASQEADDRLLSWKIGGVYKPSANGSIYVSYATSQLPPGGSNFSLSTSATNVNNPNVDPQKGTNQEIGTKWNVFGEKLALTAAVFRSTNDNEFVSNPDGTTTAIGERRVQGIELGASGIIMQNWQLNAGLAYMEPEITRGNRATQAASTDGGTIQWSPKLTFTLWNSYTFGNGLVLGGGARYVDSALSTSLTSAAALATRSMVEVPDYWVVDAMASYPISKNVTVQLNLMNLTDEEYIASLNSGVSRYYPGVERSARLGVNFSF